MIKLATGLEFFRESDMVSNEELRKTIGEPKPLKQDFVMIDAKDLRIMVHEKTGTQHCGKCGMQCFLNQERTEVTMNCDCFFHGTIKAQP